MKKMMLTLMAMLTIAVSANAMPYEQARTQALFLTDKMAYELNLTDAQYEAAYEINLDYLMSVATVDDVFSLYWERRNLDLSYILFSWQWDMFRAATYFYRPLYWDAGYWHFRIYTRYPHRDYFYFGRPHFYGSYRGGHSWRMNGGRSYYEGHRDHYRPGPGHRDHHSGMRDGWDRGDYRNHHGDRSSTRITAGQHDGGNHGTRSDRNNGGRVDRNHGDNYNNDGMRNHDNNGSMNDRNGGRVDRNNGGMNDRNNGSRIERYNGNMNSHRSNSNAGYRIENTPSQRVNTVPSQRESTVPTQRMNTTPSQRMNTVPSHSGSSTMGSSSQSRSGSSMSGQNYNSRGGSSMSSGSHSRGGSSMSSGGHTRGGGSMSSGGGHSRGGSGGGRSGGGHRR